MVEQLEEWGRVENVGEALGNLVAYADECSLIKPFNLHTCTRRLRHRRSQLRCSIAAELFMSNTRAPPLSLVTADGVQHMADEKVVEKRVPLGSNTAGCSFSLARTGSNFDNAGAPIDRVVYKKPSARCTCGRSSLSCRSRSENRSA
eukprot:4659637-Pleurochrysis_carterae.AAC.1